MSPDCPRLGVVVIGRNEAPRLPATLAALGDAGPVIYVDSGSTDSSVQIAESAGVEVLRLVNGPFTAARGRQAGFEHLLRVHPDIELVQFVDGDCQLSPGWLTTARGFLAERESVGAVAGRLRERRAGESLVIRMIDVEWDLPEGPTDVVGGISLMRAEALRRAGGWPVDLIAGEELDLSMRLQAAGYSLHRLAADMCLHDIGFTGVGPFWKRSVRTGHSYAQLAAIHGRRGPRRWVTRTLGHLVYGLVVPCTLVTGLIWFWPLAAAAGAVELLLIVRLVAWRRRRGDRLGLAVAYAAIITVCKTAAALGVLKYAFSRLTGRTPKLIEYKRPGPIAPQGEPQA